MLLMSFTMSLQRYLYKYESEVKAHSRSSVSLVSRSEVMRVKKSGKWG